MNRLFDMDDPGLAGCFIGMDEAGYGPNLGPLVIAATVWETPDSPEDCDFATLLKSVVDLSSTCKKTKLHVADSKEVNKGKYGFESLETSALVLLKNAGVQTSSFESIRRGVCSSAPNDGDPLGLIPWFQDDLKLPVSSEIDLVNDLSEKFKKVTNERKLFCRRIEAQIVPAETFNQLLDKHQSKGVALTTLAFDLLKRVWQPENKQATLFVGDKHGGRNRYGDYLNSIAEHRQVQVLEEGQQASRYQIDTAKFHFQTKGEQHLPVAAASIVAKYIRELSMSQFNTFWQRHCPDLKATKGYPVDAKRFREQIIEAQRKVAISDKTLWRNR